MAYVDTFRHKITIDEEEVFSLIKKPLEVEELQPSRFEGPVAEWAIERSRNFGDQILSRFVHIEFIKGQPHHVAWIYHEGEDPDNETKYCTHHIICDCILEAERYNANELIFGCEALVTTLKKRAWQVNHRLGTEQILDTIPKLPKDALFGKNYKEAQVEFGVRTIGVLLEHDARHPEDWIGNIVQFQHELPLLQLTFGYSSEDVKKCIEYLEEAGYVEVNDESIKLEENTLIEIINDKQKREMENLVLSKLENLWEEQTSECNLPQ